MTDTLLLVGRRYTRTVARRHAEPLGTHEAVTDAIEAEFAKARVLGSGTAAVRPVATDGRGY